MSPIIFASSPFIYKKQYTYISTTITSRAHEHPLPKPAQYQPSLTDRK